MLRSVLAIRRVKSFIKQNRIELSISDSEISDILNPAFIGEAGCTAAQYFDIYRQRGFKGAAFMILIGLASDWRDAFYSASTEGENRRFKSYSLVSEKAAKDYAQSSLGALGEDENISRMIWEQASGGKSPEQFEQFRADFNSHPVAS